MVASQTVSERDLIAALSFNPLHCGAVVASRARRMAARGAGGGVSIPFIAVQWSLPSARFSARCRQQVSIPFIAGQWSLRNGGPGASGGAGAGFNPLHCGAVVASTTSPRSASTS